MVIQGTAFPPRSSVRYEAELYFNQANLLTLNVNSDIISCQLQEADISVPVGKLPIRFVFPDGWVFVVEHTPEIDTWLKRNNKSGLLGKVESNFMALLAAVIVFLGIVVGGYLYALPWVSGKVVQILPDSVSVAVGNKILETLDTNWQESTLPLEQQKAIRQRVAHHLQQIEPLPYSVEIIFRSSNLGANAFALPGGKVILLDQLVELTDNAQQLDSIILHEIGHIHHRHMMKKLVRSSLLSIGVTFLTGESSGIVDNLAGVGVFFLSSSFSRQAEKEADQFAKNAMTKIYSTSDPMIEIFELLQQQESSNVRLPEWFSTHPNFEKRIQATRD